MINEVLLFQTAAGWQAALRARREAGAIDLQASDLVQLGFAPAADPEMVVGVVQRLNPEAVVRIAGRAAPLV